VALEDPWAFRAWLHEVPVDGAQAQREALLHLAHPATFEPITSVAAKRQIVAALGRANERELDVDAALVAIRERLTPRHGADFSFGAPPLVDRWLGCGG
jgi:5-methylcytosine-specific restriction enzyme B